LYAIIFEFVECKRILSTNKNIEKKK